MPLLVGEDGRLGSLGSVHPQIPLPRMNIVDVTQLLAQPGGGWPPLQLVRLRALEPRRDSFAAVLCQPHGTIQASAARVGNANSAGVLPMYRGMLNDALQAQAQLVITPEYSVPWELIRQIAQGGPRPPRGALWVLGCESITPADLDALEASLLQIGGVRLIHEAFDAQERAQKVFVDPVVLAFWAVDGAGADVLCLLVQFKTVVSRDPDHVELQSLYLGSTVYKFTAQPGDVSLVTLICSDAFEFTNALVDAHAANLLLIHIQLNQRPANADYAAYRARLFSVASNSNVEVVCVNWARGVLVAGEANPFNAIAGSAWYVSPRDLAPTDAEVNQLHHQGLYYSIVGERWHSFYLNFGPHTLTLSKQPVFAQGPQVIAPRIAPQVVSRRAWDSASAQWVDSAADDGFATFLQPYASLAGMLPPMCTQDPLAVERALELLEGPAGKANDWFTLRELRALHVADEESLRRITVSQETDAVRVGVAFRQQRARRAQTAATIPGQPVTWPPPVVDLSNGFQYRWSAVNPHDNVEPTGGGQPAALLYLGEDPEPDTLANIYAKVRTARRRHAANAAIDANADVLTALTQADDRLCVTYRQNHVLQCYRPSNHASITEPDDAGVNDIGGEQP